MLTAQWQGNIININKMAAILDFQSEWFLATVDLQVTLILPMNFESIALSVQEKKLKTDFQDGRHSRNLGFSIAMIWAIFDLQVTPMLPTKFWVNWPFSSEEEGKNRFSRWPPSWISNRNNFSYFYIYKSSWCFLPIFKSTGPLFQENKQKKIVSRWPPWRPSWISNPNNLSYFRSTSHPNASYQVSSQMAFQFRRRSEKQIFKMAVMAAILYF